MKAFFTILLIVITSFAFAACVSNSEIKEEREKAGIYSTNPNRQVDISYELRLDTIKIHNKAHEVIIFKKAIGNATYGGIMHSPECWCNHE